MLRDAPPPYRTVVFDCDSTLSAIEGIDELGSAHRERIAALTERAMSGELRLEDVYAERLAIVRPTRARIDRLGEEYVQNTLPHARELVAALRALGKRVAIVSGGLAPAVQRLAQHLDIPAAEVHAVGVTFDAHGAYAGFDAGSPLCRSGGKLQVLRAIATASGARPLVLVGDGITDLEAGETEGGPAEGGVASGGVASGGVDRFVAYGGVVRRAAVFARARIVYERKSLAGLVPLLFSSAEVDKLARDPEHAALVAASPHAT